MFCRQCVFIICLLGKVDFLREETAMSTSNREPRESGRASKLAAAAIGVMALTAGGADAASLTKAPFGTTKEGAAIELYTLTNDNGASVKFISYGGIITEINVPDRWGRLGNVVLGFKTVGEYEAKSP